MRILVTGGVGFIGSNLALALKKLNYKVSVIDNLDPYYQPKLKKYNLTRLKEANVIFKKIDIRDKKKLKSFFREFKPNIIVHLAAKAGVRNSFLFPEEYFEVNVNGTLNVLQAAKSTKVKKVMVASSSSVYGNNIKVPFSENDPTENQISPYAASKKAMEVLCKMYSQTFGLNIQVFRFFTVYGPSGRPDMAPVIFTRAIDRGEIVKVFGGSETSRDYTYIDDIIEGIIKAIDKDDFFEIYNLGNNHPIKLKEFISIIKQALGKKSKTKIISKQRGDVERTWADISKAQKATGYKPEITLDEGISKFISWYKTHRNLYA